MSNRPHEQPRDIVIIGGGAGGLVVASVAAQLGLRTTLIDKADKLGGDCLHFGCVPSKALLKAAHTVHGARKALDFGHVTTAGRIDLGKVNAHIRRAIDTIQHHDSDERFEALGCEVVHAGARFISRAAVEAGGAVYHAKRFVIATGSIPLVPSVPGLDGVDYLTNEDMFSLDAMPEHLIVMGAGPVGVEMAQAWARLGSKVTLVEQADRILPPFDPDISMILAEQLRRDGVVIIHDVIDRLASKDNVINLQLKGGDIIEGDALLVAAGRLPVIQGLGLEKAGVDYDRRGITVNRRMQTSNPHVYAVGDVTGMMPFTHVAEQQAGVVIANTCFRWPGRMDYRVVPAVVYTDPEVAQVGLSVSEAENKNDCSVEIFDYAELDRAIADGNTAGVLKIVVQKGRVVGAHMAGYRAGEVIHELALAVQSNMKLSKLTSMIHAYPGYSQIVRRAASQYFRDRLFSQRSRKLVQLLNHWLP